MALADLRQRQQAVQKEQARIQEERARRKAADILQSPMGKLSTLLISNNISVDELVQSVVSDINNPVSQMVDTFKARGWRQATIRAIVHRVYDLYCKPLDAGDHPELTYDEMLEPVAIYLQSHTELYQTLEELLD